MTSAPSLAIVLAAWAGAQQPARPKPPPVNEQTVTAAIDKAADYLFNRANAHGVWSKVPAPRIMTRGAPPANALQVNWPGRTALILYALATAGRESDPRFRKGLDWLMAQKVLGTYALGMRLSLIHQLSDSAKHRGVLQRDARLLLKGARRARSGSMWFYLPPPMPARYGRAPIPGDFSNVNYAVLGLWAASDERFEVPTGHWQGLERAWVGGQHDNGGWSYFPIQYRGKSAEQGWTVTSSMTTAGIASLYLIIDQTHARRGGLGAFRRTKAYQSIQRGLDWMAKSFKPAQNVGAPAWTSYYYYNVERVAAAAGLKYFGKADWFRQITAHILYRQKPDGSVPGGMPDQYGGLDVDTAFALLFLAKGSAPVIFNKLQHSGDWDNHLRELAALTGWLARKSERPANWQVVHLDAPLGDLTDSRVLYVAGTKPLSFTDPQKTKLRQFVELGGLLLFHPDTAAKPFGDSVAKLLREIWPALELTDVDLATHPLGSIYLPIKDAKVRVRQLASPVRVLAFMVEGFPANAWERRLYVRGKDLFALGANLHYYANDRAPLAKMPTKLTSFAEDFRQRQAPTDRTVSLARIRYCDSGYRWNPEPLAFARLANLMALREKVKLQVGVARPEQMARVNAKVAHLTGTDAVELTDAQWDGIHAWLEKGGTLIVDQAGGPRAAPATSRPAAGRTGGFDAAFRALLKRRYGESALAWMPFGDPLIAGVKTISYRHVSGKRRHRMRPKLECVKIAGRSAIVYSRYDLTCGLLGAPNPLVSGASAEGAYELVSRLVLAAAGIEKKGNDE